jgi:G:T-mismatch repair DNA endonuclease (very short patch repair protein)
MDKSLKEKIIEEYLSGKSSLKIAKELNTYKPGVLKVLKDIGITRKRDRCKSLDIIEDDDRYYIIRKCPLCGKDIKTTSKDKTIACRNYFNALNRDSLCKPCSIKQQEGSGNPFYGKKHTKQTKEKISKSREGKYTGNKNHMKQEKFRKMSRDIMRSNWDNGILNRECKIKSTIVSKKEKEIIKELTEMGYKSVNSYRVDSKICDVFIPSLNLILEYFGDYWHCNPKKYDRNYFNQKKSKFAWEIWSYDKNKLDLIRNNGYNLEVIWEGDLKNNNKLIKNIITKYVKKLRTTSERS